MSDGNALGVIETRGMASLIAAVDGMLKASGVRLVGRHGIGSGWVTAVVAGDVEAVRTALPEGVERARPFGEVIRAEVIPRPEPAAMDAMPHANANAPSEGDSRALGILETQGIAPLIAGADAAVKAASVELAGWAHIGGALCHFAVRGDVSDVHSAMEAGCRAAASVGNVVATLAIPRPSSGVGALLPPRPSGASERVGALGILETTGYVACVAGADAMVKVADARLCRFSIGSGGRIVALVTGSVDEVETALASGSSASERVGGYVARACVSRPDPQVAACFGGEFDANALPSGEAMGLLETRSAVALVKAVDRMLKTADVAFEGNYKVGYFLTASVVRGDVSSVRAALAVGAEEAAKHGDVAGVCVIPHPYAVLEQRMPHR